MLVEQLARELSKFAPDLEVVFLKNGESLQMVGCDLIIKPTELKCKIELK